MMNITGSLLHKKSFQLKNQQYQLKLLINLQESPVPMEAEIVATQEALLESLSLSSSSSDKSLTHQKEKIPISQTPQRIPHTQKEAGRTNKTFISEHDQS